MSEYAPAAIFQLYQAIHAAIPSSELSGIMGDRAHTYGYHRARFVLPAGDYSIHYYNDTHGDGWAASALDVKLPAAQMKLVSARLRDAIKARDPRLKGLREFGGTLNGSVTYSLDNVTLYESVDEWDDTHLWHIHLSIFRRYANDFAALKGIADVMAGKPLAVIPKVIGKVTAKAPKFTLPAKHYYGLITGPAVSHGGINAAERANVALIQRRLQALGYAPKGSGWADGKYEQATRDAVMRWQRAKHYRVNGIVTSLGWKALFA